MAPLEGSFCFFVSEVPMIAKIVINVIFGDLFGTQNGSRRSGTDFGDPCGTFEPRSKLLHEIYVSSKAFVESFWGSLAADRFSSERIIIV